MYIQAHESHLQASRPMASRLLSFETYLRPDECPGSPTLERFTNPFEWPVNRKRLMLLLACIAASVTTYAAGSYAPAAKAMSEEWHVSEVQALLGITTFCIGYAVAPMIFAPFSEMNGRYPVFLGAGVVLVSAQICCATTGSYFAMLFWRFWTGVGASIFSSVAGGVVSDIYVEADRSGPMALFAGSSTFGMGLGPLISGLITDWRWTFWVQVVICALLTVVFTVLFRETRGEVLLSQKARALNQFYDEESERRSCYTGERIKWKVSADNERQNIGTLLWTSVCRPFSLLFTEITVVLFSLWISFAWAILYLTFDSIPLIFRTTYHFTPRQASAVFTSICVGSIISTVVALFRASLFRPPPRWVSSDRVPESSLYSTCVECMFLPIGLLWLGWSQLEQIPWIIPTIAIGCMTMGINSVYLAAFGYLTNAYQQHASSAFAAQSFCRTILGGGFAPITQIMFQNLKFSEALSLLSGLSVILALVPWFLIAYVPSARKRSKHIQLQQPSIQLQARVRG